MPYTDFISRGDAAALIPEEAADQIWRSAPEASAIMSLMPTTQLDDLQRGQLRIPVEKSLPEAYFRDGEEGLSENTEMTWENVELLVGELVVDIVIKKTTLADSAFDIWGFCIPKVAEAFGRGFDKGVLYKYRAPAEWPDGLVAQIDAKNHTLDLSTLIGAGKSMYEIQMAEGGMLNLLEDNGFEADGHLASLSMKAKLRGALDENGVSIFTPDPAAKGKYLLDGVAMQFPKNGSINKAENLQISGEWRHLVWAKRQDIQMEIHRSGIITNAAGQTIHNLNQQGKVNLQFTARLGWVLPNPVNAVNTDKSTRFMFSRLKP